MALTRRSAPSTSSNENRTPIENLEEKEYEGRLVYVADLGLQRQEYKGETKDPRQQISLGIEIVGETVTVDDKVVPRMLWTKPFNIFSSLTEKGNELKYYSVFDSSAEDGQVPDWDAQLGKPCSVRVVHVTSGDNTYDNIGALLPIPERYQDGVPPATIEPAIGDADDPDNVVTKSLWGLPKYVFDKRIGGVEKQAVVEDNEDFDDEVLTNAS